MEEVKVLLWLLIAVEVIKFVNEFFIMGRNIRLLTKENEKKDQYIDNIEHRLKFFLSDKKKKEDVLLGELLEKVSRFTDFQIRLLESRCIKE